MKAFIKKLTHIIPDKPYIAIRFRMKMGKWPSFKNPKTFNEKLQWIKMNDRNPLYTKMVDKYDVKEYIAEKIGPEYLIPTLGVWDSFDDIDFDKLPDKFVLKCTHNSGGLVLCHDKSKLDIQAAKKKINASLKENYFWHSREWPYKNVKPRIIAEQFMENPDGSSINDYKIQCINGEPYNILVCIDRFSESGVQFHFFNEKWEYLAYRQYEGITAENINIPRPEKLDEMLEISKKLSKEVPALRVDLYEIGGKVYFGELTFFSSSGFDTDISREADVLMGELFQLPNR